MPNVESMSNPRDYLPNVYSGVQEREEDFVSVFGLNWEQLQEILGIVRPIKKTPGTRLVAYRTNVALQSGAVDPGEVIPYSKTTVTAVLEDDVTIEKYAKAVPLEDVVKYGATIAIEKSDEAFRAKLQGKVMSDFYTFIRSGEMTGVETTWQMALALAKGTVVDRFQKANIAVTDVIGFANVLDAYTYLGGASITIQTMFGINYIRDFMGYSTIFLLSDPDIPSGYVAATPVENVDLYYADPADPEIARLGLVYTTAGETPLIGFHANGNYNTAVGESYAIMGMRLWAEYIDGIAYVKVEASGSLGSISNVSTAAYAAGAAGDATITLPDHSVNGATYYVKTASGTAPSAPTYLAQFDPTGWTKVENGDVIHSTNNYKYRVVEVNGFGQAIASATGDVVAKT